MTKNWLRVPRRLWLAWLLAMIGVMSMFAVVSSASDDTSVGGALPALSSPNTADPFCRLAVASPVEGYDAGLLGQLRLGSYLNFGASATTFPGMDFVQSLRLHQVKVGSSYYSATAPYVTPYTYTFPYGLDVSTYQSIAAAKPGSIWTIGNEIERRDWCGVGFCLGQDEMLPELYAVAYHDMYQAIKSVDPTALIANGSLVEVTPLRLKYLDRIWNAYWQTYGQRMPVDVWNMHPYMLPEVAGKFGGEIPAGLAETKGVVFKLNDNDNVNLFKQQIVAFRQWMASKGEQNKPMIITEFGVLLPDGVYNEIDGNGDALIPAVPITITTARVQNFIVNSFDYMLTAKDSGLGYAADDYRLVQRWYWYSLNDYNFNGPLFTSNRQALSALGNTWASYVLDASKFAPALNFKMLGVGYTLGQPDSSGTLTATINVQLSNSGSQNWTSPVSVTITLLDGTPLASVQLHNVRGCGMVSSAQLMLPNITNTLLLKAVVDPTNSTPDSNPADNSINFTIIANPTAKSYLPLIQR